MTLQAIIFDFDGVLVDAEPSHMRAWQAVFKTFRISLTEEEYKRKYIGLGDRDFLEMILEKYRLKLSEMEKNRWIQLKQTALLIELQTKINFFPEVPALLERFSKKLPLAIVTGSQRLEIDLILKTLNWERFFKNVVTHNDVQKGKPDPEGFLKAFPKIKPKEIVVVEDSPYGIDAANRAGMPCIAMTHSYPAERLKKAQWIVANHAELLKLIESI